MSEFSPISLQNPRSVFGLMPKAWQKILFICSHRLPVFILFNFAIAKSIPSLDLWLLEALFNTPRGEEEDGGGGR